MMERFLFRKYVSQYHERLLFSSVALTERYILALSACFIGGFYVLDSWIGQYNPDRVRCLLHYAPFIKLPRRYID